MAKGQQDLQRLLSRKPKEECGFTVQEQGNGGRLRLSSVILEFGPFDVFCNLQMIESFNFLHTSSNISGFLWKLSKMPYRLLNFVLRETREKFKFI